MSALQIILCDQLPEMVRAWRRRFRQSPDVQVRRGDLLEVAADAYVSPANSHGWMDGGIDLALRDRFEAEDIQGRVQAAIEERGPLLPVGRALIVETGDDDVPFLVVAPTMETPRNVSETRNAYRAMRALLRAISRFNRRHENPIQSVAIPGLCTGIGEMDPGEAARQMWIAYRRWQKKEPNRE